MVNDYRLTSAGQIVKITHLPHGPTFIHSSMSVVKSHFHAINPVEFITALCILQYSQMGANNITNVAKYSKQRARAPIRQQKLNCSDTEKNTSIKKNNTREKYL